MVETEIVELEQVITCLEDDSARLLDANPNDEIAQNMQRAVELVEQLREEHAVAAVRLRRIAQIIDAVDRRCMAADGAVTDTRQEMTADELHEIYRCAKGAA